MTFKSTRPSFALRTVGFLSLTTALVSFASFAPLNAQDCAIPNGTFEDQCQHTNAGTAVVMETQPNVELEDIPELGIDGFEISVDGQPDSEVMDRLARIDAVRQFICVRNGREREPFVENKLVIFPLVVKHLHCLIPLRAILIK